MRPPDPKAESIRFGVELETRVPAASGIAVGGYHAGLPVSCAGGRLAPTFGAAHWKAERDGSITYGPDQRPCEFVSPVLHGPAGVEALWEFMGWMGEIGATVNASCGCHITVGIESAIGTDDLGAVSEFIRKLAHIAHWHAKAIYGQTGAGRHANRYSAALSPEVATLMRRVVQSDDEYAKATAADSCGRGMVNFKKAFRRAGGRFAGVVEFRAFAGTTNRLKVLHHLATVLGLCRRAAEVQCLGAFGRNKLQASRTRTAAESLDFLWNYLGWTGRNRPVALGLFGRLHDQWSAHAEVAKRLCEKFDREYPAAAI